MSELMSVKDVASFLKISVESVYVWIKRSDRPLPHFRVGKKMLFDPDSVKEWLKLHEVGGCP